MAITMYLGENASEGNAVLMTASGSRSPRALWVYRPLFRPRLIAQAPGG
jgi:hypothetical protein